MRFRMALILGFAFGGGIAACDFFLYHMFFIIQFGEVVIEESSVFMMALDIVAILLTIAALVYVGAKLWKRGKL